MMSWIWGCSNGAFLSLLCFIPLFNIVWVFICGALGNQWAWKSGKFKDLETFLAVQRTWNTAGIILFVIYAAYIAFMIIIFAFIGTALFSGVWNDALNSYTDEGNFGYDTYSHA
jgi:hypothetical protein